MHHIYLPMDHYTITYTKSGFSRQAILSAEVRAWLKDNVGPERIDRREPWGDTRWGHRIQLNVDTLNMQMEIIFKYRNDAMLFKLTWGGT